MRIQPTQLYNVYAWWIQRSVAWALKWVIVRQLNCLLSEQEALPNQQAEASLHLIFRFCATCMLCYSSCWDFYFFFFYLDIFFLRWFTFMLSICLIRIYIMYLYILYILCVIVLLYNPSAFWMSDHRVFHSFEGRCHGCFMATSFWNPRLTCSLSW